jgi:hypothetical protein
MYGPGAYVPDPTEGIVDGKDLPAPILVPDDRNHDPTPCPRGGHLASRHTAGQRTFHDLGALSTGCPRDRVGTYASPSWSRCQKSLNIDLSDGALPGSHYTRRVPPLAGRLGGEDGLPSRPARGHRWRAHRVLVPFATLQNWTERLGGKKAHGQMDGAFLDWALATFSGYVAAAALSAGPSCVLSAVDKRQYKRILSTVLDHDPKHDDSIAFLGRFKTAVADRNFGRKGITTDGSALSPEPIRQVCGDVPHPLGPFHVLKALPPGVLTAVAKARALGPVQPHVGAWPPVVPRPRGPPFGTDKQSAATNNP